MCLIENKIRNTCLKLIDYQIWMSELLKKDSAERVESSSLKQGSNSKQECLEQKSNNQLKENKTKLILLCVLFIVKFKHWVYKSKKDG